MELPIIIFFLSHPFVVGTGTNYHTCIVDMQVCHRGVPCNYATGSERCVTLLESWNQLVHLENRNESRKVTLRGEKTGT